MSKTLVKTLKQFETTEEANATNRIKTLRHLVLDSLLENWSDNPVFKELERAEDRNYILSNLNVNLPLKILSSHIQDDSFWRKCYKHRWKTLYYMLYTYQAQQPPPPPLALPLSKSPSPYPATSPLQQNVLEKKSNRKPWINIYMERHLQEFIENVATTDYEQESVQAILDICAAYINQLEINYLQPSMDGQGEHIPLDFILTNLPELHTLRLTYCAKTIGTHFYLGCNMLSRRDASLLSRGLQQCHELVNFCLHCTKLEAYQLGLFVHSLDKGCHYLAALSLEHCSLGDEGLQQILGSCNKESFHTLKYLDLTNNKITSAGAFILSKILKTWPLEKLVLRLNPIGSEGAAAIISILEFLPIKNLELACCTLNEAITEPLLLFLKQNKTLCALDLSNNHLGKEFGRQLIEVMGLNKTLKILNIKNTGIPLDLCKKLYKLLKQNNRQEVALNE